MAKQQVQSFAKYLLDKPSKMTEVFRKLCQRGEISPILVTFGLVDTSADLSRCCQNKKLMKLICNAKTCLGKGFHGHGLLPKIERNYYPTCKFQNYFFIGISLKKVSWQVLLVIVKLTKSRSKLSFACLCKLS